MEENMLWKDADAGERCCWGNKNKAKEKKDRLCTSRIRTVALRGQTYAKSSTQYLHTNVVHIRHCGSVFVWQVFLLQFPATITGSEAAQKFMQP